jgi:general secretion pathway protein E
MTSWGLWVLLGGAALGGLALTVVLGELRQRWQAARGSRVVVASEDERKLKGDKEPLEHLREVGQRIRAIVAGRGTNIPELLDYLVVQSHNLGASDIHITPLPRALNLEVRIDGLLYSIATIPQEHQSALVRRLKVMARLDVFAREKPQDGHIGEIAGQGVDIRLSTLPVAQGEKAVLRLLSSTSGMIPLDQQGLSYTMLAEYRELCLRNQGMIVLTGPTGSGKTTTIYGSLVELKDRRRASLNIVTIEDPIETELPGFSQTQVNEATGLDFARGLRSILRQDPDVIMVGEIRDAETAQIAIQAGMTGHLIFTTLHADSAAGVFNRLINMGTEPFLVASATAGVMAQRLVRRLCSHCREPLEPSPHQVGQLERMGVVLGPRDTFWQGTGCDRCLGRGDGGRIGLFELLVVDDAFRAELVKGVPTHDLQRVAQRSGSLTLLDDGLVKARLGEVSLEEVLRVVV